MLTWNRLNTTCKWCKCSSSSLQENNHISWDKSGNMSDSITQSSFASTIRRLLEFCRAQTAFAHTPKNPRFPMVKAVYCFDSSSILACQKPNLRSKQEKCPTPTKLSITSWICGSGYESFFMCRHWVSRSQCRSTNSHLSFWIIKLHYTMGSG